MNGRQEISSAPETIRAVAAEMAPTPVAEIGPDTHLTAELGYDSLGLLELVAAIEDALDLDPLDEAALLEVARVRDLEGIVAARAADLAREGSS